MDNDVKENMTNYFKKQAQLYEESILKRIKEKKYIYKRIVIIIYAIN